MRRQQRREEARRQRKRAVRQARWAGVRALRRSKGAPELTSDRWPFPCASVCGRCGALALPAEDTTDTTGDPMRRSPDPSKPNRCTHCDAPASTLIDLSNRGMATALVDTEVHDRKTHARRFRVIGLPLAGTVVLGTLAALALLWGGPVAGATLAAASLQRGATTVQRWVAQGKAPRHARRWAHHAKPQDPVAKTSGLATGRLQSSPLTGRPCLAYDVRVVWDSESPNSPRELALHEQHTGTLHVGDEDASKAFLAVEPEFIPSSAILGSPEAIEYLAKRGLEPGDGAFTYYETLVVENAAVLAIEDTAGRLAVMTREPPR